MLQTVVGFSAAAFWVIVIMIVVSIILGRAHITIGPESSPWIEIGKEEES